MAPSNIIRTSLGNTLTRCASETGKLFGGVTLVDRAAGVDVWLGGSHFDFFKNSPFFASCPDIGLDNISVIVVGAVRDEKVVSSLNGETTKVWKAQTKSQLIFCIHSKHHEGDIEAALVILPTVPTPAAFFPSWSSALVDFCREFCQTSLI
jgi:hypothetical protein